MSVLPPRPKGPPLNTLRAFETAARHGSFTFAADEPWVTPGALVAPFAEKVALNRRLAIGTVNRDNPASPLGQVIESLLV
jgi:hypothetical protein